MTDEPRIVEETGDALFAKYRGPLLVAAFVLVAGSGFYLWSLWQTVKADEEALALYAGAQNAETWQKITADYPTTPSAALALVQLAGEAQTKPDFEAAAGYYRDFLGRFPKHPAVPAVRYALAQVLEAGGKADGARAEYDSIWKAVPNDPFFAAAALGLARLDVAAGKPDEARKVLQEALDRNQATAFQAQVEQELARLKP